MKKNLLLSIFCILGIASLSAQTTILDFEEPATSTQFQYFGSGPDLEGMLTEIVANPDPSGINTSDSVAVFVKPGMISDSWAGGFSNPNPLTALDFTTDQQICAKVWFSSPGNATFKVENGNGANWIQSADVTETNTWTEVCVNTLDPSFEDPMQAAAGNIYSTLVLFFDFGSQFDDDMTYYIDDIVVNPLPSVPVDVTFSVDLNGETDFTQPYVSGSFNQWSLDNPMSDDDMDGVWDVTISIGSGAHEYKFQLDNTNWEGFNGFETCTTAPGEFVNRALVAQDDTTLPTVCFNSCYECGQAVNITINVGDGGIVDLNPEGLYIAGGASWGIPGDYSLTANGDGTHSITVERELGFSSHYTFTNGASCSWDCKENIAGQDCADPNNFNDRFMGPIMQDTIINTCFGQCTTTTMCAGASNSVTFQVDMNQYTGDPFTTVGVAGNFNGWNGEEYPMTDDDGDNIWEITIDGFAPSNIEYKFQLDAWATGQEQLMEGDPCTVTNGDFTNRFLEITEDVTVCFIYDTCDACAEPEAGNVTFMVDVSDVAFAFDNMYIAGSFNGWPGDADLMTDMGNGIWEITLALDGGDHEYKFKPLEWGDAEVFSDGDPCTITDPSGSFVNRLISVDGDQTVCFIYNTCTACGVATNAPTVDETIFKIQPTIVQNSTQLVFGAEHTQEKQIMVANALGQVIKTIQLQNGVQQYSLDASSLANGIYFINVETDGRQLTKRMIVNK